MKPQYNLNDYSSSTLTPAPQANSDMPPRPDRKLKVKLRKVNLEEKEEIFKDYYEKSRARKD